MNTSIKNTTEINISIYRNNKYYHILRFAIVKDDSYIHFISTFREKIKTSDGVNVFYKKAPDHISYHKDGKVHIKHKDGTYYDVPFKLPEKFLTKDIRYDMPWIAISYYEEAFIEHSSFFKVLEKKPDNHIIVESHNVTFTILAKIKDMTGIPLENRVIDFEVRIGGLIPDKPYPNLIVNDTNIGKKYPILNACLNPTYEELKDLRLFSPQEVNNVEKLYKYLKETFATTVI